MNSTLRQRLLKAKQRGGVQEQAESTPLQTPETREKPAEKPRSATSQTRSKNLPQKVETPAKPGNKPDLPAILTSVTKRAYAKADPQAFANSESERAHEIARERIQEKKATAPAFSDQYSNALGINDNGAIEVRIPDDNDAEKEPENREEEITTLEKNTVERRITRVVKLENNDEVIDTIEYAHTFSGVKTKHTIRWAQETYTFPAITESPHSNYYAVDEVDQLEVSVHDDKDNYVQRICVKPRYSTVTDSLEVTVDVGMQIDSMELTSQTTTLTVDIPVRIDNKTSEKTSDTRGIVATSVRKHLEKRNPTAQVTDIHVTNDGTKASARIIPKNIAYSDTAADSINDYALYAHEYESTLETNPLGSPTREELLTFQKLNTHLTKYLALQLNELTNSENYKPAEIPEEYVEHIHEWAYTQREKRAISQSRSLVPYLEYAQQKYNGAMLARAKDYSKRISLEKIIDGFVRSVRAAKNNGQTHTLLTNTEKTVLVGFYVVRTNPRENTFTAAVSVMITSAI